MKRIDKEPLEIQRKRLHSKWRVTKASWNDSQADKFDREVIQKLDTVKMKWEKSISDYNNRMLRFIARYKDYANDLDRF